MTQTIRAFIAVDISQEAKDALAGLIKRLEDRGVAGVRWVRPESIHLTLKFLGDISQDMVDDIMNATRQAAIGTAPFEIALAEIGAFPNTRNPRVLWVGLEGEIEALKGLQSKVEEAMEKLRFPRENRAFSPHLTVARIREGASHQQRSRIGQVFSQTALEATPKWQVTAVNLMRSTLTPSGAIYDRLGSVLL